MKTKRPVLLLSAALLFSAVATAVLAQPAYPSRPVRAIVAWPPGGAADVIARVAGQQLGEHLGQQLLVDNRPGASGAIGAELVAKSTPDGYTVLIGGVSELVLNPQIVTVPYNTLRDFSTVTPLAFGYYVLVIHPSLPAKSVKELIALARAHPGEIKYASGGTGSNLSLVAELFKTTAGVDITHVPYKGGGPAQIAVMSGESQMMFAAGAASVLPFVQSKRLVALAITGSKRSPMLPDVPTLPESGMPGMDVGLWFGLLAPAATPRDIIARLNGEVIKFAVMPDYRAQLAKVGFEPFTSSPEQFSAFLKTEVARWGKVIKAADIKPER